MLANLPINFPIRPFWVNNIKARTEATMQSRLAAMTVPAALLPAPPVSWEPIIKFYPTWDLLSIQLFPDSMIVFYTVTGVKMVGDAFIVTYTNYFNETAILELKREQVC